MTRRHAWVGASVVVVAALCAQGDARADEASDTAAARILGEDGLTLADAGSCDKAIEKLDRADKLHHAPTTAGRLGECEIHVGKLVEGTERIHRLLREPLPEGAPAIFVDAVARARGVLEQTLPRIPMLRVSVKTRPGAKMTVTVDGDVLSDALLDNDRPANPGDHVVRATAPGYVASTKKITLAESETKTVSLDLELDPYAVAERSPESAPIDAPAPSRSSGSFAPAVIALTIGGLGLATGAVAGALVAVKSSDLSSACGPSKTCPSDKDSEISSAKTWATASTVGFVVAGAGLATGLVLLLARHGEDPHPASATASLTPIVGPTYVGVTGGF
jgi:hypothetical protein